MESVSQEGATSRRQRVLAFYQVDSHGIIRSPGRFEGEPLWVPALWEIAREGFADSDDGDKFGFTFSADDPFHAEFPELRTWLGRKRSVKLRQDGRGFVRAF